MRKILTLLLAVGFAMSMNAQMAQPGNAGQPADPNVEIGKVLQTTGVISMSVGLPCVVAGVASLLYAELLPNPTSGYTTSQIIADQYKDMEYMSPHDYISKMEEYNGKVRAAHNAGYLLTGTGAALTIIGIPLYCYGKRIMTLNVNYTVNGGGIALNF